jgi:integrase
LPRSVPWETVQKFMSAIDRNSHKGSRDYAMFLLITTYGLRASEVVALRLDDIQWRVGRIRIPLRKTGSELVLPLTDSVGDSLVAYLRSARPDLSCREVFLRCRAPAGPLKPTAVTNAFQLWTRRSGLNMPVRGPHCLRHSYALNLLRKGVPLKVLGDLLGHKNAESTSVYLRLSIDDLRDVALDLPDTSGLIDREEGSR